MNKSKFQLVSTPKMINCNFELNEDFILPDGQLGVEISHKVDVEEIESTDEVNIRKVILTLYLYGQQDLSEVPFKLNLKIEGVFSWEADLDKETALILLNQNAPAILYSYLRPAITFLTISANLPPLVIPLMNFTKN